MFKLLPEPTNFNFRIDEIVWTSYTNNPGCSSSTTEESILPVTADPSLERKEVLSNKCNFEQQLETGASMVDKKFGDIQWDFFSQTFSTSCAPDRYFIVRLESGSPGKINRLHMVISRKEIAYKELELLAVKLAIQTFLKSQKFTSIHVQMNNIVALTYLKKIGGTRNQKLTILLKEIWEILISEQIMIAVEYLPSSLNKRRTCNLAANWTHLSWSSVDMAFAISA